MVTVQTLSADVYNINSLLPEGTSSGLGSDKCIWDGGSIHCFGTEDIPFKVLSDAHSYRLTKDGIDAETLKRSEPDIQTDITLYYYDYGAYVQTHLPHADTLFTHEGTDIEVPIEPHTVCRLGDEVQLPSGDKGRLLKTAAPTAAKTIVLPKETIRDAVYSGEWKAAFSLR